MQIGGKRVTWNQRSVELSTSSSQLFCSLCAGSQESAVLSAVFSRSPTVLMLLLKSLFIRLVGIERTGDFYSAPGKAA